MDVRVTCSPRGNFICSISRLQNLRGKRREKKMCRRRERARCRPAPSATRRSPQTPSMTAAKSREASIAHVVNVWTTVDGRDGLSRPPSQNHANATSAEPKTDDWKLSIVTKRRRSRTPSKVTLGTRATAVISASDAKLAALLLKGYRRGWLKLSPPQCHPPPPFPG